jgi:hypothetical protein
MDLGQLHQSICQSPLLKPDFYSKLICQVILLMVVLHMQINYDIIQ